VSIQNNIAILQSDERQQPKLSKHTKKEENDTPQQQQQQQQPPPPPPITIVEKKASVSSSKTDDRPSTSDAPSVVANLATKLAAGLRLLAQGHQDDLCAGFFSARGETTTFAS